MSASIPLGTKGTACLTVCLSVSVGLSSRTLTPASLLRDHQGSALLAHKANIQNQSISDHTSRHIRSNAMHCNARMTEYKSVGLQHDSIAQQHTMCPIPKRLSPAAGADYTGRELMCTVLERCRDGLSQALYDFLCLFRVQRAKAGKCLQSLSVTVSTAKRAANSNYQDLYTEGIEAWMDGSVLLFFSPPFPLSSTNKTRGMVTDVMKNTRMPFLLC